jgi:LuxR family maltose regulon positive regulatory protein
VNGQRVMPELVDSRLVIPSVPAWNVSRPRLLAALDSVTDVPLVLLSAGPGAGKTVLLAEWAQHADGRVAWLCPTPDDNEPERFGALLASALGVKEDPRSPRAPAIDFVHWLRGQLLDEQVPHVLAIDDAHVLTNPEVSDLLEKLVGYGHPQLHVALAARQDPPLPLHRYRLAGQVRELRMPDLAMTVEEVRAVLQGHQVTLPPSALNALTARTEGWAAGVRLAAMRLGHARPAARMWNELSFEPGSIGEYFMAEVLGRLPEPLPRLLIETSFLDEVTAPLAEAITDIDGAGDMLVALARGNLFVIGLDRAGTRFRYHRLFAEVLRHLLRCSKQSMPELANRASTSLEREGDLEKALYWAAKAGDGRRAASVLVRGGLARAFAHHRAIPVSELADALPPAVGGDAPAGAHPDIPLAALALGAATADSATAARKLAHALKAVTADRQPDEATRLTSTLVALMLGMRSGDARTVDDAASCLTSRAAPRELSPSVLLAQASTRFWDGAHDEVRGQLNQALAQARRCGLVGVQVDALAMLACIDSFLSRPRHADDAALQAHHLLRGQPGLRTPTALRLAAAIRSIQQADFTAAARTLRNASPSTAVSADPWLGYALLLWRATLLALSGRAGDALVLLGPETADASPPLLELHRDVLLGEIETLRGRPREALCHFERHGKGSLAALVDLPCARAYLALDDLDNARQRIRGVLAGPQLSHYLFVDSLLLDARIAKRRGDIGRALDVITNALDVAHEGVLLPFVQARDALGDLLARHPAVACRWPRPPAEAQGSAAVEVPAQSVSGLRIRLTPREQAVLSYLTTSLTAADIAAELHLSVNTVKTHIAAIYQKLGAGRRREAVRRGRELELL